MTAQYNFINSTGIISADTSDLLADVKSEYQQALGEAIELDASTPQGTLVQDETLARTSVMKNNAELANVVNPQYSYGTFLDALAALTGAQRGHNTNTIATQVAFTGTAGVKVLAGSRITTPNGDEFHVQSDVTLNGNTPVRGVLVSTSYGAIPLEVGALNIKDGIIGWGTVYADSMTTVTLGTTELSDAALKVARKRRLYQQGVGSLGAIYGRLAALDGVTSLMAIENATGAAGNVEGIDFSTPNGVWVCVAGTASDLDIATTLQKAHMGGQPWDYGGTNQGVNVGAPNGVPVVEPNSKVTYRVKFTRPVMYDAYVKVTVKQGTAIANQEDIRQAVLNYAAGLVNGEEGLTVGTSLSAYEVAAAVGSVYPGLYVKKVTVAAVPAGSTPPTPEVYGDEWTANPYDQGQINRGYIQVSFV